MSLKRLILILICGLLLIATATGCSTSSDVAEKASSPTITTAETKPSEKETTASSKEKTELYLVTRIVDGDTIWVKDETGGQEYKVRYIGINSPEMNPVECFGQAATDKNRELVGGQKVRLEEDVSETDQYGRLLRYVFLEDGAFVNETLVSLGYAHSVTYPPDVKYQKLFQEAETEARNNSRGLWSDCQGQKATVAPAETQGQCLIKGNISSSGEKIYHIPGCSSYKDTVINEEKGERWFCTEKKATDAGWRKAKNCP